MSKTIMLRSLLLAILFSSTMHVKADADTLWDTCSTQLTKSLIDCTVVLGAMYVAFKYIVPLMYAQGKKVKAEVPTAKLSDIVGSHPKEMVTFWDMQRNAQKYLAKGIKPAQSILFYGPPGNGKTEYARAIANELDALFYETSSASLTSAFMGGTSQNIAQMFKDVRDGVKSRKTNKTTANEFLAVLFMDELEALGSSRAMDKGNLSFAYDAALTTLLSELTNYNENQHILIIGATNYKEKLDAALVRPGRFDLCIEMPSPNRIDRALILEHYAQKFLLKVKNEVPLKDKDGKELPAQIRFFEDLAAKTAGFNNAELKELCHKVAMIATQQDKKHVSMRYFDNALALMKPERVAPDETESHEEALANKITHALEDLASRQPAQRRVQPVARVIAKRASDTNRVLNAAKRVA